MSPDPTGICKASDIATANCLSKLHDYEEFTLPCAIVAKSSSFRKLPTHKLRKRERLFKTPYAENLFVSKDRSRDPIPCKVFQPSVDDIDVGDILKETSSKSHREQHPRHGMGYSMRRWHQKLCR